MIDFRDFNEGNSADLREIVQLYVTSFQLWKEKTSYRRQLPVQKAFSVWWVLRGPTGFRTTDDVVQFRAMLLAAIEQTVPDPSADESAET